MILAGMFAVCAGLFAYWYFRGERVGEIRCGWNGPQHGAIVARIRVSRHAGDPQGHAPVVDLSLRAASIRLVPLEAAAAQQLAMLLERAAARVQQ